MIKIGFSATSLPLAGTVAIVIAGDKPGAGAQALDKAVGGAISRAMKAQGFKGKAGETVVLNAPAASIDCVVLVSAGKSVDELSLQAAGGHLYAALARGRSATAAVVVDAALKGRGQNASAEVAYGAALRSYRFDKYRTRLKDEDKPALTALSFHGKDAATAKAAYTRHDALARAVSFARDLVSEPPNVLHPENYAAQIEGLKKLGLKVTVLGEAEILKLKMGALYGVNQGSVRKPRVVAIEWHGSKNKKDPPLALLGKGVCFDTGGISIKPANGMDEMKYDMAGSAAVVGTMMALAARKARANVVGVVGLVENMPDGNAQRPGDIVTSMSGQTIEVLNTDAEGRLVLCDVMTYAQRTYKPKAMIDLATLTGAVVVALGHVHAGALGNNQKLIDRLLAAGRATGEKLWQLPVGEPYHRDIDSRVADMKNIGPAREAGTIVGAVFLERFVENDTPWVHLDIAGTAWADKDLPTCPRGASAFGVRLLDRLVADHYEK